MPEGYFTALKGSADRAPGDFDLLNVTAAERRRLAWYLLDDFNQRSRNEQAEIVDWVRKVIVSGATDYRRYQATAMRQRYAVRFSLGSRYLPSKIAKSCRATGIIMAPEQLNAEMADLLQFKTATFTALGQYRNGAWGSETAAQKIEHFGLWLGAFAEPADSEVERLDVEPKALSFAMMVFPHVWDWCLHWRERHRCFYPKWEIDLLFIAAASCRAETGWLRRYPKIW